MPPVRSSGVLLYRRTDTGVEVLLGHMGGPFWAKKDDGAWSVPKGEHHPDEDAEAAARREFAEELGSPAPAQLHPLGEVKGRKLLAVWAGEGNLDADAVTSNTFEIEWPPRSGRLQQFPEIDRAAWFDLDTARTKVVKAQLPFLDRLAAHLAG
ncbi:NUDIX domain-containing protein [Blastococcus sp. TF02A_35]|uniref:NUDIX domain-containing protein n=1 Tax=Blastococcus sp. TF02A-35 TaxID=2559612 RepID=UPI0010730C37|nr:NUDIX domain-containing protein [Blastococcus sp. TF02A_35]TFV44378.1 NUDIX domain-containing protein [Blastococcus sp. TF02A_35]